MNEQTQLFANITEEEYRNLPHINYSKISKFITEGPSSLINNSNKLNKNHINLGSLFDTLLTSPQDFNNKYFIGEESLSEKILLIIQEFNLLKDKSEQELITLLNKHEFWGNLKDDNRLKKFYISKDVNNYINALNINNNLKYITKKELELITYKINLLKTHPFTEDIFNNDEYELIYQAKIISDDLEAKCMFDLLVIDHVHQVIWPIDFKFMSDTSRNFLRSFEKFNYYIEATLYSDILNYELIKLDLDYEVMDFTFIVISQINDVILQYIPEINFDSSNNLVFVNNKIKKNWKYYYELIKWHLLNQVFDYTKEEYENKGIITIPSINTTKTTQNLNFYESEDNQSNQYTLTDDLPY